MEPTFVADPVRFEFDAPERVANWRPLVHWLLAIPHLIILYVLNFALEVVWFISFFTVLFTKQIPEGLFNFQVFVLRYQHRVNTYVAFMREPYPAFDFTIARDDPGGDPLFLTIDRPDEVNRWLPLIKWFLAIPHYIVLAFLFLGVIIVVFIVWFAILFTGRYPRGLFNYVEGVMRWANRVVAYAFTLVTDRYPPFRLSA